jgi:hypothetical protein
MLAELSGSGISLLGGVDIDAICQEWPRKDIENSGFELLLVALGGEKFDPSTFESQGFHSNDVWHFDSEAIEDHGSYVRIV